MAGDYDNWMQETFGMSSMDRQQEVAPAPVEMDAPAERETGPGETPAAAPAQGEVVRRVTAVRSRPSSILGLDIGGRPE